MMEAGAFASAVARGEVKGLDVVVKELLAQRRYTSHRGSLTTSRVRTARVRLDETSDPARTTAYGDQAPS